MPEFEQETSCTVSRCTICSATMASTSFTFFALEGHGGPKMRNFYNVIIVIFGGCGGPEN